MLFAAAGGDLKFGPPLRLNAATGSIRDQVRLAADPAGRVVIPWEEGTAARRRVLLRYSAGHQASEVAVGAQALESRR